MSQTQEIDSFSTGPVPTGADAADASPATRRVLDAMTRSGIPYSLKLLPDGAGTPEEVAEACGCDLDFIVHSAIFRGKATKKPFLLLHSAVTKVNDKHLGSIVGENLQRTDADFTLRLTGYPTGTVPPLAHLNRIAVMLDSSLTRFPRVWCPAGAANAIISVPTLVLARVISARIVRLEP